MHYLAKYWQILVVIVAVMGITNYLSIVEPQISRGIINDIQDWITDPISNPASAIIIAAYIVDFFGLYHIFITTAVIYFIGWIILQLGVRTK